MRQLFRVLSRVWSSPMNRGQRLAALRRFVCWQFGSLCVPGPVLLPWVNGSRILAAHRMSGSAGCAYTGLHEYEEMAFVYHLLRPEDLFLDVGANVGVFTVLAGAAVGCSCVAVEPGEQAFAVLQDNVLVNRMETRVQVLRACVTDQDGCVDFSEATDSTLSHISPDAGAGTSLPARSIDSLLEGRCPLLIKIDVEGHEHAAILGAGKTLANPALTALVLEIGPASLRYGVDPQETHRQLCEQGFHPHAYDPATRLLRPLDGIDPRGNTLYLRNLDRVRDRIASATPLRIFGRQL